MGDVSLKKTEPSKESNPSKMADFLLEKKEAGQLFLTGTVDATVADELREQGLILLSKSIDSQILWTLDLSKVDRVDSSLLAALIAWVRLLYRKSGKLCCVNVPPSLERLINLYGLAPILL